MPPSAKRQKLDSAPDISRPNAQRGIRAFGTISKPLGGRHELGKSRLDGSKRIDQKSESASLIEINRVKRKREDLPEHSSIEEEDLGRDCCLSSQTEPQDGQQRNTANERGRSTSLPQLAPKQRSNVREKARKPSHSNHVSTQSGRACLDSLPLEPSSPSDLNVISLLSSSSSFLKVSETTLPSLLPTKSLSPHPRSNTPIDPLGLPDEVQDLIDLYSSFLAALSLHYAHNGWPNPADLRALRPSVERSWRRRRVSTEDVRRIIGIAQDISGSGDREEEQPARRGDLSLVDYGNEKICIEMNADLQSQGFQKRPLDEENLNRRFAKNLLRQWNTYRETCKTTTLTAGEFISQLPLASIALCTSLLKISPLLAKGQRRLEDLKAGAIRAQQNSSKPITSCPSSASLTPPQKKLAAAAAITRNRNNNLLSRIRAKQSTTLKLQSLPENQQASILRRSALQRLQEIIPVLEILTTTTTTTTASLRSNANANADYSSSSASLPCRTSGTHSYTMPAIVQHLQTSLRNPIATAEAIRCVRLLASEVAPDWITVRELGKLIGVTVRNSGRALGKRDDCDVLGRVRGLLVEDGCGLDLRGD